MSQPNVQSELAEYREKLKREAYEEAGLVETTEEIDCDHECSGNCRREGCNCECGEFHEESGKITEWIGTSAKFKKAEELLEEKLNQQEF